mgnify:CR=1 FL=1
MAITISDLYMRLEAGQENGLLPSDPVYVYDFNSRNDDQYQKGEIAGIFEYRAPTDADIDRYFVDSQDIIFTTTFGPSRFTVADLELVVCTLLEEGKGFCPVVAHRKESDHMVVVDGAEMAFFDVTQDRYFALLVDIELSLV